MRLFLESLGVAAPGLDGWTDSCPILAGRAPFHVQPLAPFHPEILPANERRRVTPTIRLALQVASEALRTAGVAAHDCLTVFASSNGDLDIVDRICTALAQQGRPVSPTDFHNSVHNAAAGYWAIGNACRLPSTSISAGSVSFAAGLLEAATLAADADQPVLLVCYELSAPAPLAELCPIAHPCAVSLLLYSQRRGAGLGELTLRITESAQPITPLVNQGLAPLLAGNSAARCLPLLEILARGVTQPCRMAYNPGSDLLIDFTPC